MDLKIIAIVLVVSLAFAGAVFAVPGLHAGLDGWLGRNASVNATWHGCGAENATQRANATEIGEFRQAVLDGDYQTAKQLHDQYGLGGQLFGRLNETTFADYSGMGKLAAKLRQELGIGNQSLSGRMNAGAGFAGGMHRPMRGKFVITK